MLALVTGATGKVGRAFLTRLLADPRWDGGRVRALAVIDHPAARQQLLNIAMTRPVDYAEAVAELERTRGLRSVRIETPFHSNTLDNAKARELLEWEPAYDLAKLIDEAFNYQRAPSDVRKVWYAG